MLNLNMDLSIAVGEQSYVGTIRDILHIEEHSLTDAFIKQPGLYAWFAALAEIANAEVESKRLELSVEQAKLDPIKRIKLEQMGEKVTESKVTAAVNSDPNIVALNTAIIASRKQLGIIKALVTSLAQRKDMLIQLGLHKRQEYSIEGMSVNMNKVKETNK